MSNNRTTHLAVSGAGLIGRKHIEHISREATLCAMVDTDPAAQEIAVQHGVTCFSTLQQLINSETVDGIIIATPTQLHRQQALECIEAGIPVLIEKPIAQSVTDAEVIVAAGIEAEVPILVGHHRRYNPLIEQAYQQIKQGRLGKLVSVHAMCWLAKPDEYFDIAWHRTAAAGPLLTNLIHDIDVLRHLCGDVLAVQACESRHSRGYDAEDTAVLMLEFSNGALGSMTVSDSIVAPWSWELTSDENHSYPHSKASCYFIGGTHGSLSLPDLELWRCPGKPNWYEPMQKKSLNYTRQDPLALQIKHFCDVINGLATPLVSAGDGLDALRVVGAAKQAARSHCRVEVAN